MIYLDSCALVKLVVTEKETPALLEYLEGRRAEMVSSELALAEVVRVVRRSCFDGQRRLAVKPEVRDERMRAAASLLDRIDLVVVNSATFLHAAAYDGDPLLGSPDAIHLAAAQAIGKELAAFITYDNRLAQAAKDCGLPLARPA